MNNYPEVLFISWNRSLVAFVEIDLWDTWSGLKQRMRIKWESDQKKKRTIILLTIEWHWDKNWEKEDHLSNDCWRTYHFCMLEIFFFLKTVLQKRGSKSVCEFCVWFIEATSSRTECIQMQPVAIWYKLYFKSFSISLLKQFVYNLVQFSVYLMVLRSYTASLKFIICWQQGPTYILFKYVFFSLLSVWKSHRYLEIPSSLLLKLYYF